jgi:hypothetical protein
LWGGRGRRDFGSREEKKKKKKRREKEKEEKKKTLSPWKSVRPA